MARGRRSGVVLRPAWLWWQELTAIVYVATIMRVTVEFVPAKDAANRAKHGVSLSLAAALDWSVASVWIDERFDYSETRMIALAPMENVLYYVAFVDRDGTLRVISLRKASRREVLQYVQTT